MLDGGQPADAGADVDPDPVRVLPGHFQPCVVHRHLGGPDGEVDEQVHLLDFFFLDERGGIKVRDFSGDLAGIVGGVESSDPGNAGFAGAERFPGLLQAGAERRDQSHPGHHHPSC